MSIITICDIRSILMSIDLKRQSHQLMRCIYLREWQEHISICTILEVNFSHHPKIVLRMIDKFRDKVGRFLRPGRPYRARRGTSLPLPWGMYLFTFHDREDISREYFYSSRKKYIKMIFSSPQPLDYLLGEGWHRKVWRNPDSGNIIADREVLFYKDNEVSCTENFSKFHFNLFWLFKIKICFF